MKKRNVVKILALALTLAMCMGSICVNAADKRTKDKAEFQSESVTFTKAKVTAKLTGNASLFELLDTDINNWPILLTYTIYIKNTSSDGITLCQIGHDEDNPSRLAAAVTIPAGKKAKITISEKAKLGDITSSATENDVLALLNKRSIKVTCDKMFQFAAYDYNYEYVYGTYAVSIIDGKPNSAFLPTRAESNGVG